MAVEKIVIIGTGGGATSNSTGAGASGANGLPGYVVITESILS